MNCTHSKAGTAEYFFDASRDVKTNRVFSNKLKKHCAKLAHIYDLHIDVKFRRSFLDNFVCTCLSVAQSTPHIKKQHVLINSTRKKTKHWETATQKCFFYLMNVDSQLTDSRHASLFNSHFLIGKKMCEIARGRKLRIKKEIFRLWNELTLSQGSAV